MSSFINYKTAPVEACMEKIVSILFRDVGQWLWFYSYQSDGSDGTTL
jgi:hypothetical protein